MSQEIIMAQITSLYKVHLQLTYTWCLFHKERYIEVLICQMHADITAAWTTFPGTESSWKGERQELVLYTLQQYKSVILIYYIAHAYSLSRPPWRFLWRIESLSTLFMLQETTSWQVPQKK